MILLGIDLAWGEGRPGRPANETGVCALRPDGTIVDAGWTRGVDATAAWVLAQVAAADGAVTGAAGATVVAAIDAPLVLPNASGMREAEKQVARAYGRWKVAANPSSQTLPWRAGVLLRDRLEAAGFVVDAGRRDPADHSPAAPDPEGARLMLECYPYTTLVGAQELGYPLERPRYKRLDPALPAAEARAARQAATDVLAARLAALDTADPPLLMGSHPATAGLVDTPTPLAGPAHKHREDLLDAVICAWTASLWWHHGNARVQPLGADALTPGVGLDERGRPATILAPYRPAQRLP